MLALPVTIPEMSILSPVAKPMMTSVLVELADSSVVALKSKISLPAAAVQPVLTPAAGERVGSGPAQQDIIAGITTEHIAQAVTLDGVIADRANHILDGKQDVEALADRTDRISSQQQIGEA